MDEKKTTTPAQFKIDWEKLIPPHNCKLHSIILMEEHDVSLPSKRDFKKVPQIKIKNEELRNSGFNIGKEFAVIYHPGKITLVLIVSKEN